MCVYLFLFMIYSRIQSFTGEQLYGVGRVSFNLAVAHTTFLLPCVSLAPTGT